MITTKLKKNPNQVHDRDTLKLVRVLFVASKLGLLKVWYRPVGFLDVGLR